jgi:hypothetical protein
LTSGNSYPVITVTVNVSSSLSPSTVNNRASVTSNTITNIATDPTVIVAKTTTTLLVSPGAATLGQAVTMTATVTGGGTGIVTFRDVATILGSAPLVGGQATFTTYLLPAGSRSLSALYVGDSTHGTSTSTTTLEFVSAAAASGFASALTDSTGSGPMGMTLGDFNGDGKADLVTANSSTSTVSVLIGNGDGTFRAHADFNVGTKPVAVAVGDFNGDGKQDLAVVNQTGNSLSILLGKGDGTFQSAVSYATGLGPTAVAIADFNGDGIADVAVANAGDTTLSVFFGIGNGAFQPGKVVPGVLGIATLIVGDFNNDSKADLLTGGVYFYVLLGNGDGTFNSTYVGYTYGPATAGFLRNTNADVLAPSSNSVLVYLGAGTGSYGSYTSYPLTFTPTSLVVADVNGDGYADVVAAGAGSLAVMLGRGDGTLQPAVTYSSVSTASTLLAADFNGDARTDLAIANTGGNNVSVLLGVLESVLSITSSHYGNFNFGASDYYQITVTNLGPGSTNGTVTVVDTLPAGLTATSMGGVGWNCTLATLNCTRSDSLGVGASYGTITLFVNVASNASSPVVNVVSVSGGGAVPASGTDTTIITAGPLTPYLSAPANLATGVSRTPTLQWGAE